MDLVIFGLNHRTAPLTVRERWAFSEDEARQALQGAQDVVSASENLILSTCNRTEIYCHIPGGLEAGLDGTATGPGAIREPPAFSKNLEDLLDFFHRLKNFRRERTPPHFYFIHRQAAVEHLFRVAAGLDSMILGEGQILRQIRDAFELARGAGSVGKVFGRLFPAALRAGKRTRHETGIAGGCITHGRAALKLAGRSLGELKGKQVLLLGAGKVTQLVVEALRGEECGRIAVVSRTMEKAMQLAAAFGGEPFPLGDLSCLLEVSDLVISSTGATQPLVDARRMEEVSRRRKGRPLCIIDLAVPRDFDPACAEVKGVQLHNVDHLNEVLEESLKERKVEVPRAEGILREEVKAFFAQMNWIHLDPVIRHIMERFEALRVAAVEDHIAGIPPEHRAAVEALTSSLVKKILWFPIEKLKSLRDDHGLTPVEINFLRRLFLTEPKATHHEPGPAPARHPTGKPG